MSKVNPIPAHLHTITAQLTMDGASDAMAFYAKAFGAEELSRAPDPSGKKLWHAEMRIGTSVFFLNDAFPEMGGAANKTRLWLATAEIDALFKRATEAGATTKMPPMDMFWGDRVATVVDPWGNEWSLTQRIKEMTHEEMRKAGEEFAKSMKQH